MLIRCQRCQALFSLQDGVAAAGGGFSVECGRCLEVFPVAAPLRQERERTPPPQRPLVLPPQAAGPGALERKASADELARALRPQRPDGEVIAGELQRMVQRRRAAIWIGAALGLLVAAVVAFVAHARFGRAARDAQARMERARQELLRDDTQSLERATALFTEAARLSPGDAAPEAERAFALLLQAGAHQDLAARLDGLIKDLNERAMNAPDAERAELQKQAAQLAQERDPHARLAVRRLQEGLAAAKAALEDDADDPAALRALALHAALIGSADRGAQPLEEAGRLAPADPWVAYTRAELALSGPPSREKQDRALAALAAARRSEPRMLRAQVDAAAVSIDRREQGPAREALSQVLKANPGHDRARRLLSLLPAAP